MKTFVLEDDERRPLIVLMHGDREVSVKGLARVIGRQSGLALDRIYVNGGGRGFLVGVAPADLAQVLAPAPVEVGILP